MNIEAPQGTQAIIRAIRLLKAFQPETPELALSQLAAMVGLKRATTHRLLAALESEGLIARSPVGTYHLGPALLALGSQAMLNSDLRASVRPALEDLAQLTGETATLEVQSGPFVLILDGIMGKHLISASLELGTRWPLHLCSTGKALLARQNPPDQMRYLSQQLIARTQKSITDPAQLQEELALIQSRGYATTMAELEPDYAAVAAAFTGMSGQVEAAICVGGPSSRFQPERVAELGPLVKDVADRLSRRYQGGYQRLVP